MEMELTRISDGVSRMVNVPDNITLTKGTQRGDLYVLSKLSAPPEDLLESWAYRNGYEVPGTVTEATTNARLLAESKVRVRSYRRRSKKGKVSTVKSYERDIHAKVPVNSVKYIGRRVWKGERVKLSKKYKMTIQKQGALGENIYLAALKKGGRKDAQLINIDNPRSAFDVFYDHTLVEVKTGMVSNKVDSMKWSINFGQQKGKIKERLKKMRAATKERFYQKAYDAILKSKADLVKQYEKATGKKIKTVTAGLILNPKTQEADLYVTEGVHKQIRWKYPHETTKYMGTVRYK